MIRLPFDIIAYIARSLSDDLDMLYTCALLNRMWHEVCRPQILYRIVVDVQRHIEEPLKRLEHLLDSDPSIQPLVREMRISFLETDRERGSSYRPWITDLPQLLYCKLRYVRSVEIVGLTLPHDDFPPIFYQELRQATFVKRLSLVYCCVLYDVLNNLVSNLLGLEDLHIHGQWLASRVDGPDDFNLESIPRPLRMPPLKSFYYHNDDASGPSVHAFLEWIKPVRTLRSVGFHVDEISSLREVAEFLQQRRKTLESVELRFIDMEDWAPGHIDTSMNNATRSHFDLTTYVELKTLHLHLIDDISGPLLSQVAHLQASRIILTDSSYNFEGHADTRQRVDFDDILANTTSIHLPEVLFIYRGQSMPQKEVVGHLFPKLCAQDRLRFLWSKRDTDLCCML